MDLNFNLENIESIQEILNNSNFARFLSEHLSHNNVSQSEITNLLNLFSSQLNLQQRQNNNNNENSSLGESIISHISIVSNNNHSIISDSHILSDISNSASYINGDAAPPGVNNFSTKEYENGVFKGTIINNKREGKGFMRYNNGDTYDGEYKNDKKDGKGIYISIEGYKYEGEFKDGLRQGNGDIVYIKMGINIVEIGKEINIMEKEHIIFKMGVNI